MKGQYFMEFECVLKQLLECLAKDYPLKRNFNAEAFAKNMGIENESKFVAATIEVASKEKLIEFERRDKNTLFNARLSLKGYCLIKKYDDLSELLEACVKEAK